MDEQEWLASTDPVKMLGFLTGKPWRQVALPGARKLLLWACACCRLAWPLLTDERSRRAVEVAEGRADGRVTDEDFDRAVHDASLAAHEQRTPVLTHAADAAVDAARLNPFFVLRHLSLMYTDQAVGRRKHASLLREIVGNPWKPVPRPDWLTPDAIAIARRAYDSRDWGALLVLADALFEGGCEEESLLRHLRGEEWRLDDPAVPRAGIYAWMSLPAQHVLGCWAVDLILGKE